MYGDKIVEKNNYPKQCISHN